MSFWRFGCFCLHEGSWIEMRRNASNSLHATSEQERKRLLCSNKKSADLLKSGVTGYFGIIRDSATQSLSICTGPPNLPSLL